MNIPPRTKDGRGCYPHFPQSVPRKPSPQMAEVSPGRFVQMELNFEIPETVFCDVVEVQQGLYKLVPRTWENFVNVDSALASKLGLGKTTSTLRRLIKAGFVDGVAVTPKVYALNIDSYFRHLKNVSDDPEYWKDKNRLKAYRESFF